MIETIPLPVVSYAPADLRIEHANAAFCHLSGYGVDQLVSQPLGVLLGGEPLSSNQLRHRDGHLIPVEIHTNQVVAASSSRYIVFVDATEREKTRAALAETHRQLQHAQKMEALGRLAGGIAHDFNNILTVVGSYACMLEESLDAADPRQADAIEIRLAAERATQITRRLLAVGRQSTTAPRELHLDELVRGFRPMMQRLVGERVAIDIVAGTTSRIVADPGQLEQVLMNLAVNARDAMDGVGRLTIETSSQRIDEEDARTLGLSPGPHVTIAITDTGGGMSAEVQQRIFEPFFTTKDVGHGTGLGLSIVHGIIHQSHGAISVFSQLGHGTTFRIFLPVPESVSTSATTTAIPVLHTAAELPSLTVLVVDESPELRAAAARVLRDAGCTPILCAGTASARAACVSHDGNIDAAIVDIVLSDTRGDLFAKELCDLRPDLEIVLTSGYPAGALGSSGDAPAVFLPKPYRPSQLREALARIAAPAHTNRRSDRSLQPRLLVVDDDPDLRRMLSRLMKRAGFDVVDVDSGRKALAALEQQRFDVVLSDVHMSDGDGLEVLRGVRRVDLDVPVILISGKPDVATAATAVEYGAFRYLTKPVDTEMLSKVVRQGARHYALARLRRQAATLTNNAPGASDRAGLEVRFDQALAQLWLAYQPIQRSDGSLFGVEALMRSREPSIPHPGLLLESATVLGKLPILGRRVRHLAGTKLEQHPDLPSMFVNLHPTDLLDVDLVSDNALQRMASRVVLEITERESLVSSPVLLERLARLRELGFRLAVDDIGAGYSGLTSFADLTPEIVKIDMSLVRSIHTNTLRQQTVRALVALCHEVGALVVAEGIETSDEHACLLSLGCDLFQGYLLGRPSQELPTR